MTEIYRGKDRIYVEQGFEYSDRVTPPERIYEGNKPAAKKRKADRIRSDSERRFVDMNDVIVYNTQTESLNPSDSTPIRHTQERRTRGKGRKINYKHP